ncbi:MAG: hypothetical protein WC399_01275 [Bacilli bacterium]|jgi:hypothetical protein
MKKPESTIKKLQTKYSSRFLKLFKTNAEFQQFVDLIRNSKGNVFSSLARVETRKFDEEWIKEVEAGVVAIENIIINPKRFIKFQSEVVPIEMAKKTGSESIRHLAMNSQFIKKIDDKGNVMPEKILNISTDDELAIYENRFVVTLIRKLVRFIELRYDYIQKKAEIRDSDLLFMKSSLEIEGAVYEYEGKLRLSIPSAEGGQKDANDELLKRITEVRQRVIFMLSSEFMKTLKNAIPVTNPIQMTNIMKKNLDYIKAHDLWKFLDRYDQLGVTFQIKETTNQFNENNLKDIYAHIGASLLMVNTDKTKKIKVPKDQIKRHKIMPRFENPILDKDLTDERFQVFDSGRKVSVKTLTPAQEAALKKRRELAEKKRQIKQALLAKKKKRDQERKEREKERQRQLEIERKEKAETRRLAAVEKERLAKIAAEERAQTLALEKAERESLKKILDEEKRRLAEARRHVKAIAAAQRKSEEPQPAVAENPASENIPEDNPEPAEAITDITQ